MLRAIKESDWKLFRRLHEVALDRFCVHVLSEIGPVISDRAKSAHERYTAVYTLIQKRDRELARLFDDMKRTTALEQLAMIKHHGLLTEEEMAEFSADTRDVVRLLLGTDQA